MSITLHTEIVNDLLKLAVESGASDIVIKSEKPGYLRIAGRLRSVEMDPISCEHAQAFVDEKVPRILRTSGTRTARSTSPTRPTTSAVSV